jgi:hypothetical protein
MENIGNKPESRRNKAVTFPINYVATEPTTRIYLPDDTELANKKIEGIQFFVNNTVGDTATFIDPSGVSRLYCIDNQQQARYVMITLVGPTGEEYLHKMPYLAAALVEPVPGENLSTGRILPVDFVFSCRNSFVEFVPGSITVATQIIATFYWSE